jgi:hypothetical protein
METTSQENKTIRRPVNPSLLDWSSWTHKTATQCIDQRKYIQMTRHTMEIHWTIPKTLESNFGSIPLPGIQILKNPLIPLPGVGP